MDFEMELAVLVKKALDAGISKMAIVDRLMEAIETLTDHEEDDAEEPDEDGNEEPNF